jgi:hypothetical protein
MFVKPNTNEECPTDKFPLQKSDKDHKKAIENIDRNILDLGKLPLTTQ